MEGVEITTLIQLAEGSVTAVNRTLDQTVNIGGSNKKDAFLLETLLFHNCVNFISFACGRWLRSDRCFFVVIFG